MAQPRKRAPRKRASKATYSPDVLRLALDAAIAAAGLPPARKEYQFARAAIGRQWRLDLSWPEVKICLEIEGGTHIEGGGAHQRAGRGGRYLSDMEKYNTLALWGWVLVRVTYEMIADGRALAWLEEAFAYRAATVASSGSEREEQAG